MTVVCKRTPSNEISFFRVRTCFKNHQNEYPKTSGLLQFSSQHPSLGEIWVYKPLKDGLLVELRIGNFPVVWSNVKGVLCSDSNKRPASIYRTFLSLSRIDGRTSAYSYFKGCSHPNAGSLFLRGVPTPLSEQGLIAGWLGGGAAKTLERCGPPIQTETNAILLRGRTSQT